MTNAGCQTPFYYRLIRECLPLAALWYSIRYEPASFAVEEDQATVRERAGVYFDMFGNAILRMAYSYLHNYEDSEEILQETLIQYMTQAPRFANDKHAKVWLLRVAANLSKNRLQYNRYRLTDELDEQLTDEGREDLSFVWEAVKALKPTQREVIHLFYHEGFSTREIAGILRRNESSVRSDLRRGREALKKVLKEAYDFE